MASVRDFWSISKITREHDREFWKELDKAKKAKELKKKKSGVR